jgi:hypothetical protein
VSAVFQENITMRAVIGRTLSIIVLASLLALTACGRQPPPVAAIAGEPFVPGLGELMSLQQMRHTKLWFAGEAGNWQLASYEIDELEEGFDDIVRLHPTHKDSPVAPKDAIPAMVRPPLARLRQAVDAHDRDAFRAAFDGLTQQCNSCHQATNFAFNRVQRPSANPPQSGIRARSPVARDPG